MNTLISVIIPVYNVEEYLKECVDSVVESTYKNLDIILVDDGSSDRSGELCDSFAKKDARIRVLHKENGGLSSARNAGIDIAIGDYILFVDSDDWIDKNMIQELCEILEMNPVDMIVFEYVKETGGKVQIKNEPLKIERYHSLEFLESILCRPAETTIMWNKLMKRQIWEQLRFPLGKQHEDAWMIHYICERATQILWINKQYYHYRMRQDSIMHVSYNPKRLDGVWGIRDQVYFLERRGKDKIWEKSFMYYTNLCMEHSDLLYKYWDRTERGRYIRELCTTYRKDYMNFRRKIKLDGKNKFRLVLFLCTKGKYITIAQKSGIWPFLVAHKKSRGGKRRLIS